MLEDLFDGCFDPIIARRTICYLGQNTSTTIIKCSRFARRHILIIDDIHLFQEEEIFVFDMILSQVQDSYNNCVLIFSNENLNLKQTNMLTFELEGLQSGDIIESLRTNLLDTSFFSLSLM